jgi:hypothetical protein
MDGKGLRTHLRRIRPTQKPLKAYDDYGQNRSIQTLSPQFRPSVRESFISLIENVFISRSQRLDLSERDTTSNENVFGVPG